MEFKEKYHIDEDRMTPEAVFLGCIANEFARMNEGIEAFRDMTKFLLPLLEKAFEDGVSIEKTGDK